MLQVSLCDSVEKGRDRQETEEKSEIGGGEGERERGREKERKRWRERVSDEKDLHCMTSIDEM